VRAARAWVVVAPGEDWAWALSAWSIVDLDGCLWIFLSEAKEREFLIMHEGEKKNIFIKERETGIGAGKAELNGCGSPRQRI